MALTIKVCNPECQRKLTTCVASHLVPEALTSITVHATAAAVSTTIFEPDLDRLRPLRRRPANLPQRRLEARCAAAAAAGAANSTRLESRCTQGGHAAIQLCARSVHAQLISGDQDIAPGLGRLRGTPQYAAPHRRGPLVLLPCGSSSAASSLLCGDVNALEIRVHACKFPVHVRTKLRVVACRRMQETKQVFEKLYKYIGKDIKTLIDRADASYVIRLQRNRVFYVREEIMRRATNVRVWTSLCLKQAPL